ncbi:MAG TPA: hypothetical protein VLT59_05270, partial [Steroidobacteraceae bacterium]|nr:hypothetical protein [Steroidobacteraceae bacterium]
QYFVYIKEEEPAIASVFYKYGVKYKCIGWEYYHPTGMAPDALNYSIPADRPYSSWNNGPAYGIHFAVGKFYLLNSAVWSQNDMFRAWQSVLIEPYRNLPWPKPEDVRDRQ